MDRQADHSETLRLLLESRGCVVLMARDAASALGLVAAYRPDALVIELDVPEVRQICDAAHAANPLGVFVAGIVGLGKVACGCIPVRLVKPYRFADVAASMDVFLAGRDRGRRVFDVVVT